MTAELLLGLIAARLGSGAVGDISDDGLTVTADVPPQRWLEALAFARDELGCDVFDWLSAVDELPDGFAIVAHVYAREGRRHLLLRMRAGRDAPYLPTATEIYGAAAQYERDAMKMFGVTFDGHPDRSTLLLPDGF